MELKVRKSRRVRLRSAITAHGELYLLFLPVAVWYIIFCCIPMGGIAVAFKDFKGLKGICRISNAMCTRYK